MNIHGHKLKIQEIKQELKKGKGKIGDFRFNKLTRRKQHHLGIIKYIKEIRIKNKIKIKNK